MTRDPSYAGLTVGLFALILLPPLLAPLHDAARLVVPVLFLAAVAHTLWRRGSSEIWALRGLLVWLFLRFSAIEMDNPSVEVAAHGLGAAAMIALTVSLFGRVVGPGPVDVQRLYIASSTYLLAGFAFSTVFQMVELAQPGSFSGMPEGSYATSRSLVYFSFMTLTTVGYGDIAPQLPLARALVTVEAAAGQLYLAVLVGRLIGLHLGEDSPAGRTGPAAE